ncbi:unnamed protein product, partial [Sphacelaria rigidula]
MVVCRPELRFRGVLDEEDVSSQLKTSLWVTSIHQHVVICPDTYCPPTHGLRRVSVDDVIANTHDRSTVEHSTG